MFLLHLSLKRIAYCSSMASKTGSRAPLGLQQKAVGAHYAVKAHDLKSLPSQVLKTNKPKLIKSEKSEESGMAASGEPREDAESQLSRINLEDSLDVSPGNSDSKVSSTRSEQVSTTGDVDVRENEVSLDTSEDQEKKVSNPSSAKVSSVSAKISDVPNSLAKTSGSAKVSDRVDIESGKSSVCRGSTGSDVSDESTCSSFSSGINKPHKANDMRWEAIQALRSRDGVLGLSHFRLLKRLGCGDIGSVYLAELTGTKCYFAMKVMDKASLAGRKKLLRAQTEREILQSLDHPFLPTLYIHFETDKFSCLVMEFCPGGDLHTLRQRQPGKYFSEQAVK